MNVFCVAMHTFSRTLGPFKDTTGLTLEHAMGSTADWRSWKATVSHWSSQPSN